MGTNIHLPLCRCTARDGTPKRAHLTKADAEAEIPGATALITSYGHDAYRTELRPYLCPDGNFWHLGTVEYRR